MWSHRIFVAHHYSLCLSTSIERETRTRMYTFSHSDYTPFMTVTSVLLTPSQNKCLQTWKINTQTDIKQFSQRIKRELGEGGEKVSVLCETKSQSFWGGRNLSHDSGLNCLAKQFKLFGSVSWCDPNRFSCAKKSHGRRNSQSSAQPCVGTLLHEVISAWSTPPAMVEHSGRSVHW